MLLLFLIMIMVLLKRKKVIQQDKFRGVTIYNTFKPSDKVVIDRLDKQLKMLD